MAAAPNNSTPPVSSLIQPGKDHSTDSQALQNNVSDAIKQIYGDNAVVEQATTPTQEQAAVTNSDLAQQAHPESDWEDITNGWRGRPRTEPAKNFLKLFIKRLRKQNPEKEVTNSDG